MQLTDLEAARISVFDDSFSVNALEADECSACPDHCVLKSTAVSFSVPSRVISKSFRLFSASDILA